MTCSTTELQQHTGSATCHNPALPASVNFATIAPMPETHPRNASQDAPKSRTDTGVPVRKDARAKKLKENMRRRKEAARNKPGASEDA